jgi:6-phosphogluconolactonase
VTAPNLRVVDDPAAELAGMLCEVAEAGGNIVLTGGSSPTRAYELAAARGADWRAATIWFADERCVPPSDERSNYRMADATLLSKVSPGEVFRMEGELGPDAGAGHYEGLVWGRLGAEPRWDFLLLGLGPDAHTASLFPSKPEKEETTRLVVGVPEAGMEPQVPRISLTVPALNSARHVVFLVTGESKRDAVRRAFVDGDRESPAARVRPSAGELTVLLDPAAAP